MAASSIEAYIASLPPGRREIVGAIREAIVANLPSGYEESRQAGMIGYVVPLSRYPKTYNQQPLQYAAIANHKAYVSLYLIGVYGDPEEEAWFKCEYAATGRKLDMGKSCVHFKRLEDVPQKLIGEAVARMTPEQFIALYEHARAGAASARSQR